MSKNIHIWRPLVLVRQALRAVVFRRLVLEFSQDGSHISLLLAILRLEFSRRNSRAISRKFLSGFSSSGPTHLELPLAILRLEFSLRNSRAVSRKFISGLSAQEGPAHFLTSGDPSARARPRTPPSPARGTAAAAARGWGGRRCASLPP